jgi:hypothetical protein
MVDDRTQRPFGSSEPAARGAAAKPSGNDPLAELARLIGQNDPFGEFGRDGARRASAPPAHQPPPSWADEPESFAQPQQAAPAAPAPIPAANNYYAQTPPAMPPNFGRQSFGGAPLGSDADMYQVETTVPGYAPQQAAGYEQHEPYNQSTPHLGPEEDDYYEDEQPSRRRMGILVIAGVFALAVIGTAGAFGYRALFGSSSVSGPPPVIKAESSPSKVVPVSAKDPQSSKQITDRINDNGLGEKLVSREEAPVPITPQPNDQPLSSMPQSPMLPQGNGVVGAEPKKVRTIAIRPDQGTTPPDQAQQSAPPQQPVAAQAPPRVIPPVRPAPPQPARAANNNPLPGEAAEADAEPAPPPAPRQVPARAQPRAAQASVPRSANAPLSLSPDAPAARAPARAAAPVARTASVAPAASSGGSSYLVQVSSQRSEADAQAAFQSLQGKYPSQLGGKAPVIRKVELGEKGTYYRAMVPAGDSAEANRICSGIKAAGGSCIVQRN